MAVDISDESKTYELTIKSVGGEKKVIGTRDLETVRQHVKDAEIKHLQAPSASLYRFWNFTDKRFTSVQYSSITEAKEVKAPAPAKVKKERKSK